MAENQVQAVDPVYEVPEEPVYNPFIRALKTTDPANAETVFNPLLLQMIVNIHAAKLLAEGRAPADHNHDNQYDALGAAAEVAALVDAQGQTVAAVIGDMTRLTFELAVKGMIDTDGMQHVIVDRIESSADINILKGRFDSSGKKVFI